MIRVLHVTEDHSTTNTGITSAIDSLTRCVPVEITPAIACVGLDSIPLRSGVDLYAFPTRPIASLWRYSPGSAQSMAQAVAAADVVQVHGLWMWPQWAAAHQAIRQGKPLVVTSHGFLQPWMWQRQSVLNQWKKKIYWKGWAYPAFRQADMIHALTPRESGVLQAYFPGCQPQVIPHGIDLIAASQMLSELPGRPGGEPPYFLYLGRLHPGKGIHLLIRAFARLPQTELRLKIAGPIQQREQAYADAVRRLVDGLGLSDRIVFTGEVRGAAKWQLYRDAWAFCLPSFSEVIGLVNLEAAAAGTPVITSFETGITADWERNGGILLHPDEEQILSALQRTLAWSPEERRSRGNSLHALVERQYSWERVGQQWADAYRDLVSGKPKVSCAS